MAIKYFKLWPHAQVKIPCHRFLPHRIFLVFTLGQAKIPNFNLPKGLKHGWGTKKKRFLTTTKGVHVRQMISIDLE
jgi:hypothetical protein